MLSNAMWQYAVWRRVNDFANKIKKHAQMQHYNGALHHNTTSSKEAAYHRFDLASW